MCCYVVFRNTDSVLFLTLCEMLSRRGRRHRLGNKCEKRCSLKTIGATDLPSWVDKIGQWKAKVTVRLILGRQGGFTGSRQQVNINQLINNQVDKLVSQEVSRSTTLSTTLSTSRSTTRPTCPGKYYLSSWMSTSCQPERDK